MLSTFLHLDLPFFFFFPQEASVYLSFKEKSHTGQLFPVQQMKWQHKGLKEKFCLYMYRMTTFLHSKYDSLYILSKYTLEFSKVVKSLFFISLQLMMLIS